MILDEALFKMQNLGIRRKDMPQIKSEFVEEFRRWLRQHGVTSKLSKVKLSKLRPSQVEYDSEKVAGMYAGMSFEQLTSKPIFVSKDLFVLDGHHRYMAALQHDKNGIIPVIIINASGIDALNLMHQFPKTTKQGMNEDTDTSSVPTTQDPNNAKKDKKMQKKPLASYDFGN